MVATAVEASPHGGDRSYAKKGISGGRYALRRGRSARSSRTDEGSSAVGGDSSSAARTRSTASSSGSSRMSAAFLRSTLRRATSLATISSPSAVSSKSFSASASSLGPPTDKEGEQGDSPRSHRALFRMHRQRNGESVMHKETTLADRRKLPAELSQMHSERSPASANSPGNHPGRALPTDNPAASGSSVASTASSLTGHDAISSGAWRIANICPNGAPTASDWWRRDENEDRQEAVITSLDDDFEDAIIMEDSGYSVEDQNDDEDEDITLGRGRGNSTLRDFYCGFDPTQMLAGRSTASEYDEDTYDDLTPMGSTDTPSASHSSGRSSHRCNSGHSSRLRSVEEDDDLQTMPSIEVRPRRRRFYNCGRANWERVRSAWRTASDRSVGRSIVRDKNRADLLPQQYDDIVAGLTQPMQRTFELPQKMPLSDLIQIYVTIWDAEGTD